MSTQVAVIDRLSYGGSGICRIDGKVCFVPFSCPGDEVRLKITAHKKSYCSAGILEIILPSLSRTVPVCPVFTSCGGCSWQHIHYEVQLAQKRQIFADTFWRGARVGNELIRDVEAAPECYGYRSRAQFKVSVRHCKLNIGFFRNGSHAVEDAIHGCPVVIPQINEMLGCFRTVLPAFTESGAIPQISIDAGVNGLFAVVHYSGNDLRRIESFLLESLPDLMHCAGLFLQTGHKSTPKLLWGSDKISYLMPGRGPESKTSLLTYRSGGFAQVNRSQNLALLSLIRQMGCFTGAEKLLDLYCGNGNFSIPLANETASVLGIDGFKDSIISAEYNRILNGVNNAEFVCDDVCSGLKRLVNLDRVFDIILLDPPRSGAGDAVPDIVRLNPDRIIYVSCDPGTLARDCGLLAGHGYRVADAAPLDMFPQTYHLESVTLLVKT